KPHRPSGRQARRARAGAVDCNESPFLTHQLSQGALAPPSFVLRVNGGGANVASGGACLADHVASRAPFPDSKIALRDSIDSQPPAVLFARKNFFTDSFLGLRGPRPKDFPRVAALQHGNTPPREPSGQQ
ncbi:MAG TPA: hypothetical protein VK839_02270, partial [Erythrobacter sp.]|nr:hypothetical protein [Erythrobacter sp.]